MIFVHISKLDLYKCKQILDCTRPLGPTRCLRYLSPPLLLSPYLSAKWELATPLENFWAELCYWLIFKVAIWFNRKIPCCMLLSFSETEMNTTTDQNVEYLQDLAFCARNSRHLASPKPPSLTFSILTECPKLGKIHNSIYWPCFYHHCC